MSETDKSYEIRTKIENLLGELTEIWEPEEVLEFVEQIADEMREEIAEMEEDEEEGGDPSRHKGRR